MVPGRAVGLSVQPERRELPHAEEFHTSPFYNERRRLAWGAPRRVRRQLNLSDAVMLSGAVAVLDREFFRDAPE
jgi:hypothetical protein